MHQEVLLRKDIFSLLGQFRRELVNQQIANLFTRRLGDKLGQLRGIDAGEPVVACTACGYDPHGMPVLHDLEVRALGIMTPTVRRVKI